jgi:hypothetical protein
MIINSTKLNYPLYNVKMYIVININIDIKNIKLI